MAYSIIYLIERYYSFYFNDLITFTESAIVFFFSISLSIRAKLGVSLSLIMSV